MGRVQDPPSRRIVPRGRRIVQTRAAACLPEETFTILAWSRQTMSPGLGTAPASVAAADISASSSEVCLPGSLVTPDQREVCPLSREGMLPPLSIPLQGGLRFLPHPLPTIPSVLLTKGFPGVQGHDRFTTFRICTMHGLGPASSPVIALVCVRRTSNP